jgi:hypothetical protein
MKRNYKRITSNCRRLNSAPATLRAITWGRRLIWRAATGSFAGCQPGKPKVSKARLAKARLAKARLAKARLAHLKTET